MHGNGDGINGVFIAIEPVLYIIIRPGVVHLCKLAWDKIIVHSSCRKFVTINLDGHQRIVNLNARFSGAIYRVAAAA